MMKTMTRIVVLGMILCLACGALFGCGAADQPNGIPQEPNHEDMNETGFEGFVDTSQDDFIYMRPTEEEMAAIEVLSGADFSTISMEALQGYWYCDEGYGYEIFVEVTGDTATIREKADGITQEIWYGTGVATISQPGENGWKNPGLDIRTEDGDSIALIVLRRVGEGYFTTANSGTFYKIEEK